MNLSCIEKQGSVSAPAIEIPSQEDLNLSVQIQEGNMLDLIDCPVDSDTFKISPDPFTNPEDDFADFASGDGLDDGLDFSFDVTTPPNIVEQPVSSPGSRFFDCLPDDLIDTELPAQDFLFSCQAPRFDSRCSDLWQSLAFNEDLVEARFNNRRKLRWKQSLMRRHCMLAMGIPFNLDESNPKGVKSIEKMASTGYEMKDAETIARRFDTTMAHSLCNIGQEMLASYSISDLSQLDTQVSHVLEEVSLSIEHWRSKLREVEEGQETYNMMIANLVSHTHKAKLTVTSPKKIGRSTSSTQSKP
ncbi:hypothetical protein DSO57_1034676 [Entomophthora muscae]|uniref:Uncharacterized protein n=1 Tax=Entomophthora muscae TaxID=34485 RepID=A0ACC2UKQ8_9FUNG|nr:hypothetical protein DSO57_1034676 [Entomophthora muscae]